VVCNKKVFHVYIRMCVVVSATFVCRDHLYAAEIQMTIFNILLDQAVVPSAFVCYKRADTRKIPYSIQRDLARTKDSSKNMHTSPMTENRSFQDRSI
jgi:hypothetical protein